MRFVSRRRAVGGALAAFILLAAVRATAVECLVEQSIQLRPGWNAVFLEVEPATADLAAVFSGIPVASVWTWQPRTSTVTFLRDPGEGLRKEEGWYVWFPPSRGEQALLSNLSALGANRPYLIELVGDASVAWTVRGCPSLKRQPWLADSFNLTGFTTDPAASPSYASFFASSGAHVGQAVYRLDAGGSWRLVENSTQTAMRPGEAFWVYTSGSSDFAGPLSLALDFGDDLDFGATLPERRLRLKNSTGATKQVVLNQVSSGAALPLRKLRVTEGSVTTWPELRTEPPVRVVPGKDELVRLSLRRAELSPGETGAILEITDGEGSLVRVPVRASLAAGPGGAEPDHAGLWVGTVRVNAVTESQIPARPEYTIPQPTGSEFIFKIIVHVDAEGRSRLLKEVIQMKDADQFVLITDDSLIPQFEPVTLLAGEPFSHRVSTAAYDFDGTSLGLSGLFSLNGTLLGAITLGSNQQTNPFKHAYHPDHNNLDELGNPISNPALMEAYQVGRTMELAFSQDNPECAGVPECANPPDWGYTRMGGVYRETLTGLHRNPIKLSGIFLLTRVSDVAVLNPEVSR
jgi:hypothetical protein